MPVASRLLALDHQTTPTYADALKHIPNRHAAVRLDLLRCRRAPDVTRAIAVPRLP